MAPPIISCGPPMLWILSAAILLAASKNPETKDAEYISGKMAELEKSNLNIYKSLKPLSLFSSSCKNNMLQGDH
jgi:hypothetical protein